jgi:hypothetical protein
LHLTAHALYFMLVFHIYTFAIDPAELKLEEPTEQAQVEDFTNLDCIKASPGTLTHDSCLLLLNLALCSFMIVH